MKTLTILILFIVTSCTSMNLKKDESKARPTRLGVLGFKITAPLKKIKDIQTVEKDQTYPPLNELIAQRELEAKQFFIQYMNSYYKNIETIDIPIEKVTWKKELRLSHEEILKIKDEYQVDALIIGEVPWYGKTNLMYPAVAMTADIAIETAIIGIVTDWNVPLITANLAYEIVTGIPLWFGGAYLFGKAYKPVTINAKLYEFGEQITEKKEEFDVTKSAHQMNKLTKKERKKIENQLNASMRKALKEIAIELNEEDGPVEQKTNETRNVEGRNVR